jgi:3-oxoacyl-[acyl-carrier protein] reductase
VTRLEGRTAFITGGASGLGRAQAIRFAQEGAQVVVADLNEEGAKSVVAEIEAAGGEAIAVSLNVADAESVKTAVERAIERFGKIDVLSNTAGIFDGAAQLGDAALESFRKVFQVNVDGMFSVSKAVLPHMLELGKGSIINFSSNAGLRGGAGGIAYTTSKHAVIGFTRQMAAAYGKQGIRVNAIAPGMIQTPMAGDFVHTPEGKALFEAQPAGRLGQPEDIANAALFLASDESDFIHAVTLSVDGGMVDTF